MPKRHLTIVNQEREQQSVSSIVTRQSLKRMSNHPSIPNKKTKVQSAEEKHTNKENQPNRSRRRTKLISIVDVAPIVESEPNSTLDLTDEDDDSDAVDYPPSFMTDIESGRDHSTNQQYLAFEHNDQLPFIISKTARYWSSRYRRVIRHTNPDHYRMFIHSDFNCYGELEIVENCLIDLAKTIFVVQQGILDRMQNVPKETNKVNYILGFRRLEALTILLEYTDSISGIDNGDRFDDVIRLIGACYVTILRGLLPKVMFTTIERIDSEVLKSTKKIGKSIPNFRDVLEQAMVIGFMFLSIGEICSAYTVILRVS
jgi:hypothetical protein